MSISFESLEFESGYLPTITTLQTDLKASILKECNIERELKQYPDFLFNQIKSLGANSVLRPSII